MHNNADLNRIIDKVAETAPVRFAAGSPNRDEVLRPNAKKSSTTPDSANAAPNSSANAAPRRSERANLATSTAASRSIDARNDDSNVARPNSRPFSPRLAVASTSPLEPTPKSPSQPRRDGNAEKNGKNALASAFTSEKKGLERRDEEAKRSQRRRQIDPTTCERDYSADEIEFMKALDDYKRTSGRMFPTCSEILEVFKSLGYVKIARSPSVEQTTSRKTESNRVSTPAFLNDEINDAPLFEVARVPGVA